MGKSLALVVAVTLTLTGCIPQPPAISDEDLERWQAAADRSLPGASHILVTVDEVYCYTKCGEDLQVDAAFPTYQELLQHEDELLALEEFITNDSPELHVTFTLSSNDKDEATEVASDAMSTAVGGDLAITSVTMGAPILSESGVYNPAYLSLYLEDAAVATPNLLREVMDAATDTMGAFGATIESIHVSTLDGVGLSSGEPGYSEAIIDLRELDQFTTVATDGCVTEGEWAFDISGATISPWPIDSPGGACA